MRFSVAAVALSLVVVAVADFSGRPPPPPPPGSACLDPSDKYRPPKSGTPPAVAVENESRSLGITSLPRQWARDVLGGIAERAEHVVGARCVSLQCACVHAGRKTSYGVYKKVQCPVAHGASWEACNVQEDGYTVRVPNLWRRRLLMGCSTDVCDGDSASSRAVGRPWRGGISRMRSATRHSRALRLFAPALDNSQSARWLLMQFRPLGVCFDQGHADMQIVEGSICVSHN